MFCVCVCVCLENVLEGWLSITEVIIKDHYYNLGQNNALLLLTELVEAL